MEFGFQLLCAPITALEFSKSHLFAGTGPFLSAYNLDTKQLHLKEQVLPYENIHGICLEPAEVGRLCVYGQKCVCVLNVVYLEDGSIESISSDVVKEFRDWIWDVKWLHEKSVTSLAIATGHNTVINWDFSENSILQAVHCEEKCILYSAHFIGSCWEDLILASGTVFSEVVLWVPAEQTENNVCCKVFNRLRGHQGVIFGMDFNKTLLKFCSVSDDRSLNIWGVEFPDATNESRISIENWKNAIFRLEHVLYGHSARVWNAKLLNNYVVSIGEDATCVWTYEGKITKKFKGHKGKGIWSLAVNSVEDTIATGGGDCSIRIRQLDCDVKLKSDTYMKQVDVSVPQKVIGQALENDFAKVIALKDIDHVLISTNNGYFYEYSCNQSAWKTIQVNEAYQSYSVVNISPDYSFVAIGNIHGDVAIYDLDSLKIQCEITVHEGKVHNIILMELGGVSYMLSSGPLGHMILWIIKITDEHLGIEKLQEFTLPYCKQRWISAATLVHFSVDGTYLICGDRGGTVHLYTISDTEASNLNAESLPKQSFPKIHGKAGVTSVCCRGNMIYTTGRDGLYREYNLVSGKLELLATNKVYKGFDWIEKLVFLNENMQIFGFHTCNFVVWSVDHNQKLLEVECGGGHRAWDYLENCGESAFAFIKNGQIQVCRKKTSSDQIIIQPSLHGRQLTCVKHLYKVGNSEICVTASEDTTVNVTALVQASDCGNYKMTVLKTLQGHLSSVRAMALCYYSKDSFASLATNESNVVFKKLLFTAGGRAEMKCWKIELTFEENSLELGATENSSSDGSIHCKCELLQTHMLNFKGKKSGKPWKKAHYNPNPETRYMGLTAFCANEVNPGFSTDVYIIGAACSDGLVRLFAFCNDSRQFHLITETSFHNHCVLIIGHVFLQERPFLYSGATDGKVAFWDMSQVVYAMSGKCDQLSSSDHVIEQSEALPSGDNVYLAKPICVLNWHQSGVNSIAVKVLEDAKMLVATGGDDNALHLSVLCVNSNGDLHVLKHAEVLNAHAAQITGVSFLNSSLLSASIDQRVCVWDYTMGPQTEIKLKYSKFVHVADVSSMDVWTNQEERNVHNVVLSGVGLQWLTISSSD